MSTTAELNRVAHGADSYDVTVFFTEQSHCALIFCLCNWKFFHNNWMTFENHLVDQSLCLCNLLSSHSREMAEVETAAMLIVVRTCLMNVGTQYLTQSQLKQMTYRVVGHDAAAALCIYLCSNGISGIEAAFGNSTDMHEVTFVVFLGIFNGEYIVAVYNDAGITDLTTGFAVEGGLVENQSCTLTFFNAVCDVAVTDNCQNGSFLSQSLITGKFGCIQSSQVDGIGAPSADIFSCFSCTNALFIHQTGEFFLVDGDVLFAQNFAGQIDWEAEGIVQTECIFTGKNTALTVKGSDQLLELFHTLVDGLLETFFLCFDNLYDVIFVFTQFRICTFVFLDNSSCYFMQEGALNAEQSAMTCSTAEQSSQNVASAFIGRKNTVTDHEGGRADVVGDNTQGNICFWIVFVGNICNAADVLHNVLYCIYLEQVADILHNASQTFQTHTGIDVWFWHTFIMTVAIRVKLGEYQIPDLHEAIAIAANLTFRSAAANAFAAIEVDLRARTARTGTMFPEVILFAETNDTFWRNTNLFSPDLCCFIVLFINRDPQFVCRNFQNLSQKFPCPCSCFYFEIIAE